MSAINNGGPAFPAGSVRKSRPAHDAGGDWVETDRVQPLHQGLTIRDYFAAKAMTQTMREFDDDWKTHAYEQDTFLQWAAERAYKMADAMLKVRES